jgi:peptidoglycan/LPS O-acetylase OafA/YrhL
MFSTAEEHKMRGHSDGAEKHPSTSASASTGNRNRDKIRCLDGLRGIACLIVFNYHFFWPWTPFIMLGWGALPPNSPEPHWGWQSLPIVCLLHRGRPMVAIFFAISGYVLCRHILRAIHERRIDAAYQSLASAVFRRAFRLYIPPALSMFLVAILAQFGVFRSEESIYEGPDSKYINGTVSFAFPGDKCYNGTILVDGPADIAHSLGLRSSLYLGNVTDYNDTLCLNVTTEQFGPSSLYILVKEEVEAANHTLKDDGKPKDGKLADGKLTDGKLTDGKKQEEKKEEKNKKDEKVKRGNYNPKPLLKEIDTRINATNSSTDYMWVQLGGSWEEHPWIHDNMTYALQNFTRVYAEWANPFNFGHYHPRYDPHTFTIPMELRGSMFLYIFLLGTAALKTKWRLTIATIFTAYALQLGRWDMATFMGGMTLSEIDIIRGSQDHGGYDRTLAPPATARGRFGSQHRSSKTSDSVMRWLTIVLALYFLSYPDAGAEYTPGFVFLSDWVPRYYIPLSGWMFYQSMGALLLLPCILRSPTLIDLLESKPAQYLGKVSFSFYLIHGPVLHSLGFWIMPRLFDIVGRTLGYLFGYIILLSASMYLTGIWHKKVDAWSVTVGRKVERMLLE